jgi:hypothetical protein
MTTEETVGTPVQRELRVKERDLLEFVLPVDAPGYARYRSLISGMVIIGDGRRGPGNFVLGRPGDIADITSPLAPIVAYGMVETTQEIYSVTVREYVGDQIDVEMVSSHGSEVPEHFEERRRWTYSNWHPGMVSPATGDAMREVAIDQHHVLAIAAGERRILLHASDTSMNYLLPVTNLYNELMIHLGVRDANVALDSRRLFTDLASFGDADFRAAFVAYNVLKRRVTISGPPPSLQGRSMLSRLFRT